MTDLMRAVTEIRRHADHYERAAAYYHGEVRERFDSVAARRALGGRGYSVNLARRPVDAVLDRMQIRGITVPGDETAHRQLVDRVWTPNRMDRYSKQVHWAALTYGDAYVIAWPGEQDGTVDMFYNSPLTTRVFYAPENPRVKAYAAKLWCEGDNIGDHQVTHRCDLYYPDRIERYVSQAGSSGKQDSDWLLYVDDGQEGQLENPYGVVPVFHWRTGEPYGRPEHRDAWDPQDAITKLCNTLMGTIDFQGFPQRYALLDAPGDPAEAFDLDADDGEVNPASRRSAGDEDLQAGPGTVWRLSARQVGQFQPAQAAAFLEPAGFFIRAMAAATATPLRFFDPQGQIPSGEALRADEAPLKARIEDAEAVFTEEWQALLMFSAGVIGEAIAAPDIQWAPPQVIADEEGWKTALLKVQAGVPTDQVLTETGYLSDTVGKWQAGSEKPNLDTRLAALDQVAGALQKLGAAVSLGAVDQGTVSTLLGQLLGELVQDEEAAG